MEGAPSSSSLFLGSSFRKFLAVLSKELLDGRSSFLGIRAIMPGLNWRFFNKYAIFFPDQQFNRSK